MPAHSLPPHALFGAYVMNGRPDHLSASAAPGHACALHASSPASHATRTARRMPSLARACLAAAALLAALSGCGGGGGGGGGSDAGPPPPAGPVVQRTLVIDLDAAIYRAVQDGITSGALPNLAKL
ncbi:MAG: hypothetical protein EOO54_23645, partial [Haliea sp.]